MAHMVVLILDRIEMAPLVLDAWEATGVGGVTVISSTGLGRIRKRTYRDDLPLMPSLAAIMQASEEPHSTMLTIVEDEELLNKVLEVTQALLGDMTKPNTGILFAVPVSHVIGLTTR